MATINPKRVLPTSPINIFALGQFQIKNPPTDVANNIPMFSPESKKIAIPANTISDPIYPSIPSRKLNRLIDQMMAINANKINAIDKIEFQAACCRSKIPKSKVFKPPNIYKAEQAQTNWTKNRTTGFKLSISSANPIILSGNPQSNA